MAAAPLGRDLTDEPGVAIGTMHRMKGLEFRAVAVMDVSEDEVPLPAAVTLSGQDAQQHQADLQRECCLLYVACTRAREHLWVAWAGRPSPLLAGVVASPVASW